MRSVNSLRKRWQSWVFSKVLDIMVSHTGSAILGTEYKFQMVPLRKGDRTHETVTDVILGRSSYKGIKTKTIIWIYGGFKQTT